MRHLFVVDSDSLDMHIQNEKEFVLASARGDGAILYFCGEY